MDKQSGRKYPKLQKGSQWIVGENYDNGRIQTLTEDIAYIPLSTVEVVMDDQVAWYKIPVRNSVVFTDYGWIKKEDRSTKELYQYDLKELGFTMIEEQGSSSGDAYINKNDVKVVGEIETSVFFKSIYEKIDALGDKDGTLSLEEIQKAWKTQYLADRLQKIVGYHPSEWYKEKALIDLFAERINQFVDDLKGLVSKKADIPEKTKKEITGLKKGSIIPNDVTDWFKENILGEDPVLMHEQERIDELVFWDEISDLSGKPKVYHFHPIAFIEYAQSSSIPLWLEVAWEEYEKYKGVKEHEEPLASRIKEYHGNTIYANSGKDKKVEDWSHTDSWCASFVKWCMNKAGFDNTYLFDTTAYGWKPNVWKSCRF